MATTKISQIIIRKGNLSNMKGLVLAPGEFMLMGDEQRLFLGQQPLEGNLESSGPTEANVSFTVRVGGITTPLFLNDLAEYKIVSTQASDSSITEISSVDVAVSDPDGKGGNDPIYTFDHGIINPITAGAFVVDTEYKILTVGTTDFTLIAEPTTSGSFVIGREYKIVTAGTTDYTSIGSTDSVVDTIFTATGVGIGTGTAERTTLGLNDLFTATGVGAGTGTANVGPVNGDTFVLYYNKEVTTTPTDDRVKRNSTTFTNSGNAVETTGINFFSNVMNDITMDYTLFDATYMRKGTLNILVNGSTTSSIEDKFIGDSELSDVEFSITNDGTGKFILNFKTSLTTGLQFNYTQTSSKFVTS
jgi:hypothetical protein